MIVMKILKCTLLSAVALLLMFSQFSCGKKKNLAPNFSEAKYTVLMTEETISENGCRAWIEYPVIRGSEKDDAINSLVRSFVISEYKMEGLISDDDRVIYYTTEIAEITFTSAEFFSGYFAGRISSEGSLHDSFFAYTINCDVKNGRLMKNEELIGSFENLKKSFLSGKFKAIPKNDRLIKEIGYENLFSPFREDYSIYPDVYISDDGFGVCLETMYLYGGYSLFLAPYLEAEVFMSDMLSFINLQKK